MNKKRFIIDYNEEADTIALYDNKINGVFILDKTQVLALIEWYCNTFERILV